MLYLWAMYPLLSATKPYRSTLQTLDCRCVGVYIYIHYVCGSLSVCVFVYVRLGLPFVPTDFAPCVFNLIFTVKYTVSIYLPIQNSIIIARYVRNIWRLLQNIFIILKYLERQLCFVLKLTKTILPLLTTILPREVRNNVQRTVVYTTSCLCAFFKVYIDWKKKY